MGCYKIDNAVADLLPIFTEAGYSKNSIEHLKYNIQIVVRLHQEHGEKYYTPALVENYIRQTEDKFSSGKISRTRKNSVIKAARYVHDFATTGTVVPGVKTVPDLLPPHYRKIMNEIYRCEQWSSGMKKNIMFAAHTYFRFLADSTVRDISTLTEETIRSYILQKAAVATPGSLDTIRRNLKHLHLWLYEKGYVESDYSGVLTFMTPHSHRIKKPIPLEEIALVLNAIDRNTAIGKRDYAMFMIAIVTGMRSVDIASLEFSNIDWINGEIRITQKKTDIPLSLPLTADVGEALKDYILHGRPDSNCEKIFLTSRAPFRPLGRRGVYSAFNHVRESIGLRKCPFHGLRRALGTNMVVAGIPVTTVAQVLGHTEVNSTKQYISLDSVHLMECALGLDGIPLNRGEI